MADWRDTDRFRSFARHSRAHERIEHCQGRPSFQRSLGSTVNGAVAWIFNPPVRSAWWLVEACPSGLRSRGYLDTTSRLPPAQGRRRADAITTGWGGYDRVRTRRCSTYALTRCIHDKPPKLAAAVLLRYVLCVAKSSSTSRAIVDGYISFPTAILEWHDVRPARKCFFRHETPS